MRRLGLCLEVQIALVFHLLRFVQLAQVLDLRLEAHLLAGDGIDLAQQLPVRLVLAGLVHGLGEGLDVGNFLWRGKLVQAGLGLGDGQRLAGQPRFVQRRGQAVDDLLVLFGRLSRSLRGVGALLLRLLQCIDLGGQVFRLLALCRSRVRAEFLNCLQADPRLTRQLGELQFVAHGLQPLGDLRVGIGSTWARRRALARLLIGELVLQLVELLQPSIDLFKVGFLLHQRLVGVAQSVSPDIGAPLLRRRQGVNILGEARHRLRGLARFLLDLLDGVADLHAAQVQLRLRQVVYGVGQLVDIRGRLLRVVAEQQHPGRRRRHQRHDPGRPAENAQQRSTHAGRARLRRIQRVRGDAVRTCGSRRFGVGPAQPQIRRGLARSSGGGPLLGLRGADLFGGMGASRQRRLRLGKRRRGELRNVLGQGASSGRHQQFHDGVEVVAQRQYGGRKHAGRAAGLVCLAHIGRQVVAQRREGVLQRRRHAIGRRAVGFQGLAQTLVEHPG